MKHGREGLEKDIDEAPRMDVFVSLAEQQVLKVGESDNLRRRIARDHLRYGNPQDGRVI